MAVQAAACVAEHKAETAALRGEVETLRSLVVVLDDQTSRKKSNVMAFIGAVLAGAAAVLAAVQVFIALFGTGGVR